MAGTEKPGGCQTQHLWPVGHNTENRGRLQHTVPDGLSDELQPEEKITKYILQHYPMEMALCHILAVDGVQKATRCTMKDGPPTRQVEVHLIGGKREHLDLGL